MSKIDRSPEGLKKALQTKPFNLARRRMKKAAATIKRAGRPQEGIWYCCPTSDGNWKLLTWEGDTYHSAVWPIVVRFHLAKSFKLNESQVKEALNLPYSVPRGRVSMEADGKVKYFFVRHGNDTPSEIGLSKVLEEFNLIPHYLPN